MGQQGQDHQDSGAEDEKASVVIAAGLGVKQEVGPGWKQGGHHKLDAGLVF